MINISKKLNNPQNLYFIESSVYKDFINKQNAEVKSFIKSYDFSGELGSSIYLHNHNLAIIIINKNSILDSVKKAYKSLPSNNYKMLVKGDIDHNLIAFAWALSNYSFNRYKANNIKVSNLEITNQVDLDTTTALVESYKLAQDLINTPANDLGPSDLADEILKVADHYHAKTTIINTQELKSKCPTVYAVGKGSSREPLLVELNWGNKEHFKLTLIGKGICYDTGGLNIKPPSNMMLMKKDMGGAAHALALAKLIMELKLPVSLKLIIPLAENSINGNAMRQGDVITTAKGINVEITNTDAEGRLVLADALHLASSRENDLIIDFATLTGAARVALGPDVAVGFTNNQDMAHQLTDISFNIQDNIHFLPLWDKYNRYLHSNIADCINSANTGFAGSITAALFLQKFLPSNNVNWMHFDIFGWSSTENMANVFTIRALLRFLKTII